MKRIALDQTASSTGFFFKSIKDVREALKKGIPAVIEAAFYVGSEKGSTDSLLVVWYDKDESDFAVSAIKVSVKAPPSLTGPKYVIDAAPVPESLEKSKAEAITYAKAHSKAQYL